MDIIRHGRRLLAHHRDMWATRAIVLMRSRTPLLLCTLLLVAAQPTSITRHLAWTYPSSRQARSQDSHHTRYLYHHIHAIRSHVGTRSSLQKERGKRQQHHSTRTVSTARTLQVPKTPLIDMLVLHTIGRRPMRGCRQRASSLKGNILSLIHISEPTRPY